MKLMLEANGFAQFKIKKNGDVWELDMDEVDKEKPKFILYTGTETAEEKEILRNIYNSSWDFVGANIAAELKKMADNNYMGDVVKIIMITSSGAEGINLANTRFVHIVEPYWHMTRIEQVVGRARRICSHQNLPEEYRNVKVYLYITVFNKEQATSDQHMELITRDTSKLDKKTPVTTDESLFEISRLKEKVQQQFVKSIKETSIDCSVYAGSEELTCFNYGKVESNQFGSIPRLEDDAKQSANVDVEEKASKIIKIKENDKEFAYNKSKNEVYNMEDYQRTLKTKEPLLPIGRIVKDGKKNVIQRY